MIKNQIYVKSAVNLPTATRQHSTKRCCKLWVSSAQKAAPRFSLLKFLNGILKKKEKLVIWINTFSEMTHLCPFVSLDIWKPFPFPLLLVSSSVYPASFCVIMIACVLFSFLDLRMCWIFVEQLVRQKAHRLSRCLPACVMLCFSVLTWSHPQL